MISALEMVKHPGQLEIPAKNFFIRLLRKKPIALFCILQRYANRTTSHH